MRAVLLVVLLAGCLVESPDLAAVSADVDDVAQRLIVQGHDHMALGHGGAMNMELVGYHNGVDESGDPNAIAPGAWYTELAVEGDWVAMARSGTQGGFALINVATPEAPRFAGSFEGLPGADVEFSDDGRWAFFATQRNDVEQLATQSRPLEPGTQAARGISIVDLADVHHPVLAGFTPLPINGPHTITYHRHSDGQAYLLACTYDLLTAADGSLLGTLPLTQRLLVYRVHESAAGIPALSLVNTFQILESAPAGRLYMPHDVDVQYHPVTGHTLLYVAYWDKGVRIVDFSDPMALREIGHWNTFQPSTRGNIHQAKPFDDRINGRHITVAEPEIIAADETGYLALLDTTDPTQPTTLAHWTLPGHLIVEQFEFSPHNFDTWGARIALGHNHAGLWVLGVDAQASGVETRSLGFYLPELPREDSPRPQPWIWGVFEQEGLLYAVDEATGLHVVRYTGP